MVKQNFIQIDTRETEFSGRVNNGETKFVAINKEEAPSIPEGRTMGKQNCILINTRDTASSWKN